jgi:hypothetical protein
MERKLNKNLGAEKHLNNKSNKEASGNSPFLHHTDIHNAVTYS